MPFGYYPAALDPLDVWDLPHDVVDDPLSIGQLVKDATARGLNFFDSFNFTALDADVWTEGGDAGGASTIRDGLDNAETGWTLRTQNVLNNDWYWVGNANELNKTFTPFESDLTTVDWRVRLGFMGIVTQQALWGLFNANPVLNYAEPVQRCAHFFHDPGVALNYRCRSWSGAEEETDSGVLVDALPHDFRILWERTQVRFYIDDVLVATHAAQVPLRPMFSEFLIRTGAAANRYLELRSHSVEVY